MSTPAITIIKETFQVQVTLIQSAAAGFVSFSAISEAGQTDFTLPKAPNFLIYVAVNGVIQSIDQGDFSLSDETLSFNEALDDGDIVAGVYV